MKKQLASTIEDQEINGFFIKDGHFHYYSIEYSYKGVRGSKYSTNLVFKDLKKAKKVAKALEKLQSARKFKPIECKHFLGNGLAHVNNFISKFNDTQKLLPEIAIELKELRKRKSEKWQKK